YRVLREYGQGHRRGRAQPPPRVARPRAWVAQAPLQVWSWDITFLPTTTRGQFYRLDLVLDVYSRMIVGWEVHADELAEHAATLITEACLRHGVRREQLVLHADNGSPMKGPRCWPPCSGWASCPRSAVRRSATTTRIPRPCFGH